MPTPYKARVDTRAFLNLPGVHGGATVVAYVEDTSARALGQNGDTYFNVQPRTILEISDCQNRISLELDVHSDCALENSLHKLDVLTSALDELRAGLVAERALFRKRSRRIERLERDAQKRRRARRTSAPDRVES